ncbi:MAG: hypothetical protein L3J63_08200 [Geopsychrobacter sp.]|nr:hypothetical protein [Geopsychrobacter sp.]
MILNPGILALLFGTSIAFVMLLYAAWLGLKILSHWNPQSSSEEQLLLERKTYLVSTLVNYAFGFEIFSGLLFIYTVEDIHRLFIGAMCATGALNANQVGWLALLIKIILFFAAALWVHFNRLDQRTEDTPLVRPKYLALLLLTPLVGLDLYLQYIYFSGLQPEIITSCCGSLFSLGNDTVASELAGLPVAPTMLLFFLAAGAHLTTLTLCLGSQAAIFRHLLFVTSLGLFFISLAAIISFISLYIYQLPTHHCPFDMLQKNYNYIGYPLYICLFGGTLFGLLPGLSQPLKKIASLKKEIAQIERRWLLLCFFAIVVFLLMVAWPILFGPFILLNY